MHSRRTVCHILAAVLPVLASAGPLAAEPAADSFQGKQITMVVPSGVGGGYDLYGRFVARHIGKHIPGSPSIVVKNMPGAGGIVTANHLYSIDAADGLTIGLFQNTITLNQLAKTPSARFDVRKFGWLGSKSTVSSICALSGKAKTLQAKDLFHTPVILSPQPNYAIQRLAGVTEAPWCRVKAGPADSSIFDENGNCIAEDLARSD